MEEPESKENPTFLEYIYKLNESVELKDALDMSLKLSLIHI